MCCVDLSLGSTGLNHYMFDLMLFLSLISIYISLLSSLKAWNAPTTCSVGRYILLNTFLNWKHLLLTVFQAQFIPTLFYYGEFWNLNYFFKSWSRFLAKGRGVAVHWRGRKENKDSLWGNSLVVQWLGLCAFTAKGTGSVPSQGTKTLASQSKKNSFFFFKWRSKKKKKMQS